VSLIHRRLPSLIRRLAAALASHGVVVSVTTGLLFLVLGLGSRMVPESGVPLLKWMVSGPGGAIASWAGAALGLLALVLYLLDRRRPAPPQTLDTPLLPPPRPARKELWVSPVRRTPVARVVPQLLLLARINGPVDTNDCE